MSVTERLQAMDQLWDSLTRKDDEILHQIGIKMDALKKAKPLQIKRPTCPVYK